MLRSIKQLYEDKLKATDGEIGSIKDFYFDEKNWEIRYVVVDTGSWLAGHLVLISPRAFINFDLDGVIRGVSLSRKQTENSPGYDSKKPALKNYREDFYHPSGWPNYWQGGGLWGIGAFPLSQEPLYAGGDAPESISCSKGGASLLQSTKVLNGYEIQTEDGPIGHLSDFIVDHETWAICHLVVETGHWFLAKEIVISPKQILSINYEDSKIFVKVSRETILKAPEYHVPPWAFNEALHFAGS